MYINQCPICNEFILLGSHICSQKFYVWRDYECFEEIFDSKNYYSVFANNEESAAEKFAGNDWEFPDETDVWVIDSKIGDMVMEHFDEEKEELNEEGQSLLKENSKHLNITSEIVRNFYANIIEE
jgi:hypothetical protein